MSRYAVLHQTSESVFAHDICNCRASWTNHHALAQLLQLANNVVPEDWDWREFFVKAGCLLPSTFEKSDAQKKYGQENVSAALMGGRSLRATGELLSPSNVQTPLKVSFHGFA